MSTQLISFPASSSYAQAAQSQQRSASGRVRPQQQGGGMQFDSDFDADQIFNMFFG
jgi:hypothetical protein